MSESVLNDDSLDIERRAFQSGGERMIELSEKLGQARYAVGWSDCMLAWVAALPEDLRSRLEVKQKTTPDGLTLPMPVFRK